MRVVNFGSVNIDHVYAVDHFVRPGETISSKSYRVFAGGKGFNQSIAVARAGAQVTHVGKIGHDGKWLRERLRAEGVDTTYLQVVDEPTGHAVIQVNADGENAIVLYSGANHCLTTADINTVLDSCSPQDLVLIQNETNAVAEILQQGALRGLKIVFNPAPMTDEVLDYPLEHVGLFVLNETEAQALTNESDPKKGSAILIRRFPRAATVLTLGSQGAMYSDANTILHQSARIVEAVDTTGAGDTFIGFFLSEWLRNGDPQRALSLGCRASAICVTRHGAADSIPFFAELVEPIQDVESAEE